MSTSAGPPVASEPRISIEARQALRVGWICLALFPATFVVAMLVGDWLLSAQGYSSGDEQLPLSVALRASVPGVLVLVAPLVAAAWWAQRAAGLGHPRGRAVFMIATALAAGSIALNLVQVLAAWLLPEALP